MINQADLFSLLISLHITFLKVDIKSISTIQAYLENSTLTTESRCLCNAGTQDLMTILDKH